MDSYDKYIGRILDNRYEILELIGTGGMAYVYKAKCHRLNRLVAIKILKEDIASDEEFQRRFYAEAQAIAMLSHPNIVAVYDVSRSGSTEYIVMELIEGITLKQYISRKGLLNWKETLHFATQMTKALTHAHQSGVIHRDIKPHNIMILKDGSVKVADFGIAQLLSVQNTLTRDAFGSVHYISPEQAKGGLTDARSDIYSIGVVMYEMLTSRLPFMGETAVSVAIQHISAIPLMPRDLNPEIPIGLEEITMHAMEPDVNTRFATAEEMLADLEVFKKNPAVVFEYDISDPADRISADSKAPYVPRVIPKDAIAAPNRSALSIISPKPKSDLTSNEYRDAKRRSNSTATLFGILAVVVVVVVLLMVFILPIALEYLGGDDNEERVYIPNFIDQRYEDVIINSEYIELFEFNYPPEYVNSQEVEEGVIISQDPAPDRERRKPLDGEKIPIRLIVSSGDEPPVEMPNIIGLHWVEARNTLANLKRDLDIRLIVVDDDTREEGIVFETTPRYGQSLWRGDIVEVKYANPVAERTVMVPDDLVGKTQMVVELQLASIDLVPVVIEQHDEFVLEGYVTYVDFAGIMVPIGSNIQIVVSLGPAPTPEPPTEEPPTEEPPTEEPPNVTEEPPDSTEEPPDSQEP